MAAPASTQWGSIVTGSGSGNYRKGRIGIYTNVTSTATTTTINVQVWFWTIYSCSDGSNNLYFDIGAGITAASTYVGSVSVYHSVDSGEWSESNQTKLWDKTYSYTRTANANQVCNIYAKYNGIDLITNGTMYASTSVTIPALASYTISYNANGGSGAPSSQTKWYGKSLTLSSTVPTRTGYTFKGWSASAYATSPTWYASGSYSDNTTRTLYAVWEAITYSVSYNANGGSGAPSSQTKTYGVTLTLSSTVPTRTNYNFKGWGTSALSTTASYSAGGSYTANAAAVLYAVWELAYVAPRITDSTIRRVDDDGRVDDFGTKVRVAFSWETDKTPVTISVQYKQPSWSNWSSISTTSQKTSGTEDMVTQDEISTEESCDIRIIVTDNVGSSTTFASVPSGKYIIDCLSGGNGIAFGKVASAPNAADFAWDILDKFGTTVSNGVAKYTGTGNSGIDPNTTLEELILTNKNSPISGQLVYIRTVFYSGKSTTNNRAQIAMPYNTAEPIYRRYYYNGSWSSWHNSALDAYPVDSIYISYSHTSPASLFGGTWERITNAFLWASQSDGVMGLKGGEQTHTLTVGEMPSHSHGQYVSWADTSKGDISTNYDYDGWTSTGIKAWQGFSTQAQGNGTAHNNMPPYIQVSIWRRTA